MRKPMMPLMVAHASGAVKPTAEVKMCNRTGCDMPAKAGDRLCATHRAALEESRERGR